MDEIYQRDRAKMEIALNISRIEFLKFLDLTETVSSDEATSIGKMEFELFRSWVEQLQTIFGNFSFDGVYLGSEFCERLMPSAEKIREVISECELRNMFFSLVTPFVSYLGIDRIKQLIPILEEYAKRKKSKSEIVVNDFGVLHVLQEHREWIAPVIGRGLHKMKRDPCTEKLLDKPELVGFLRTIRCSGLTTMPYQAILKKQGCARVELDPLEQGYGMNVEDVGFCASLHLPYQYITAGRYCLAGSLNLSPEKKFTVDRSCQQECGQLVTRLEHEQVDRPVFRRGNAVYAAFRHFDLKKAIDDAGISRIVLAPGIPA
jgi:hypothetical protein